MVKNNEFIVLITSKNIKYYERKGYQCLIGSIIAIDIDTMPKMSHNKVIAICELCNAEKELYFSKYNSNKDRHGFYSCKKCSNKKRTSTNIIKYGIENTLQSQTVRDNNSKWMRSDEFKEKSKESLINSYNVDRYSKTDEFKKCSSIFHQKRILDLKEGGLYNCPLTNINNKELRDKAMFEKYVVTYSYNIQDIKDRVQKNNLKKFGHISPFGNKEVQDKIRSKIIYENLDKDKKFNGDLYKINLFKLYRRKVRYQTDLIRSILFENWDGFDYYDGSYINDNFIFNKNDSRYPTIDHKISCFSGFINGLDPEELSKIENLCITKRGINSIKNRVSEMDFLKKLKLNYTMVKK